MRRYKLNLGHEETSAVVRGNVRKPSRGNYGNEFGSTL